MKKLVLIVFLFSIAGCAQDAQHAKNVILFLGDAGGLSTLHAASIHRYGDPAKLYVQRMPHLGWSDTSSADDWITDSAAGMTAIVTGVKTNNGVLSEGPSAIRGKEDGEPLKTLLEFAEEHGLSTGVISNDAMTGATPAACYAHVNDRDKTAEILMQLWKPRFGDGVDVVFGPGRTEILAALQNANVDARAALEKAGYFFGNSLSAVPAGARRAIVLTDDDDFDVSAATELAIRILSRNKKGFFLMVESDLHTDNFRRGIERAAKVDDLVQTTASNVKDTLILFTADHSFDMRISGSAKRGAPLINEVDGKPVPVKSVIMQGHHSAEQVLVAAEGPGSQKVKGFMANTDLFRIMMAAYGWKIADAAAAPHANPAVRRP